MVAETTIHTGRALQRLALLLGAGAFVLIVIGGLVTTYRVGMAVPDWPTTFGYNMFTYPLEQMLENFGVTIEHSHRLAASCIGLLSIAALLVSAQALGRRERALVWVGLALEILGFVGLFTHQGGLGTSAFGPMVIGLFGLAVLSMGIGLWLARPSSAVVLATIVHALILAQGLLGGSRVLENATTLAFLHGALAQLVYAAIGGLCLTCSLAWRTQSARLPAVDEHGLRHRAWIAWTVLYAQIVLGAWLRHSGRSDALVVHILVALLASGALLWLARGLGMAAPAGPNAFSLLRRAVLTVLMLQVGLGLLTTVTIFTLSGGFQGVVSVSEAISATAHVACGALLLALTTCCVLWSFHALVGQARGAGEQAKLVGRAV